MNERIKDYFKKFVATGVAVAVMSSMNPIAQAAIYEVKAGDSLYFISQRNGITVEQLKISNQLLRDQIHIGEKLIIPESYTVKSGDTIFLLAQRFDTTMGTIMQLNNLKSDALQVGQALLIPIKTQTVTASSNDTRTSTYKVVSGDSLWFIAQRYNTTVDNIIEENKLITHHLWVGQTLLIPAATTTAGTSNTSNTGANVNEKPAQQNLPKITYHDYFVKSGDTGWSIAIDHGMPFHEFLVLNKLNQNSWLTVGQKLQIAKYNIPINNPANLNRGAYMDWWTEAQYVFPIGAIAKVTDIQTGLSWNTKRTIGANHADCEPLTARDAQIMLQAWGGKWSWQTRAILIEVNGHRLAASASAMPHDIQYITNNNFNGHYDIYFGNSTRHVDGKTDANHERNVRLAAGM